MKRPTHTVLISLVAVTFPVVTASCLTAGGGTSPDPENLSKQLLEVTDLESQWNETQRQVFTTRTNENPSIDPSIWCPDAQQAASSLVELAGEAGADVEMEFKGVGGSARLLREQAWSNENTQKYFDTVREAAVLCDGKKWTDEPGVTNSISLLTDTKYGDESVSWSSTTSPPASSSKEKYSSSGRVVVARIKNVIMVLQAGDFAPEGSGSQMTAEDWKVLATRASKKIDKVNWK